MHLTGSEHGVVHAEGEVEGAQGVARYGIDLRVEEGAEGAVHGECVGIAVGEIHARGEHRHGYLSAVLRRHCHQLIMNLLVVRGVDDKLQTHIVKRLREFHATLERHATP